MCEGGDGLPAFSGEQLALELRYPDNGGEVGLLDVSSQADVIDTVRAATTGFTGVRWRAACTHLMSDGCCAEWHVVLFGGHAITEGTFEVPFLL